jgi:hypothetical protein
MQRQTRRPGACTSRLGAVGPGHGPTPQLLVPTPAGGTRSVPQEERRPGSSRAEAVAIAPGTPKGRAATGDFHEDPRARADLTWVRDRRLGFPSSAPRPRLRATQRLGPGFRPDSGAGARRAVGRPERTRDPIRRPDRRSDHPYIGRLDDDPTGTTTVPTSPSSPRQSTSRPPSKLQPVGAAYWSGHGRRPESQMAESLPGAQDGLRSPASITRRGPARDGGASPRRRPPARVTTPIFAMGGPREEEGPNGHGRP